MVNYILKAVAESMLTNLGDFQLRVPIRHLPTTLNL